MYQLDCKHGAHTLVSSDGRTVTGLRDDCHTRALSLLLVAVVSRPLKPAVPSHPPALSAQRRLAGSELPGASAPQRPPHPLFCPLATSPRLRTHRLHAPLGWGSPCLQP